jgi:hypothetical protein
MSYHIVIVKKLLVLGSSLTLLLLIGCTPASTFKRGDEVPAPKGCVEQRERMGDKAQC